MQSYEVVKPKKNIGECITNTKPATSSGPKPPSRSSSNRSAKRTGSSNFSDAEYKKLQDEILQLRTLVTKLKAQVDSEEEAREQLQNKFNAAEQRALATQGITSADNQLASSIAAKATADDRTSAGTNTTAKMKDLSASTEDDSENIIVAGWLNKKGRKVRNWKKRWFVLKGAYLRYYESNEPKAKKLGEINLETCVVEALKERGDSQRPCMALFVEGRKFLFCADTSTENKRWYLFLLCKNAELTYLRKIKAQGLQPDPFLVNFLRNPVVTQLDMSNKPISIDVVAALSQVIGYHNTCSKLQLKCCNIDNLACTTLCNCIISNVVITHIDLTGNDITEDGAKGIAKVIKANYNLRYLNLESNRLGNEGAKQLVSALALHAKLRTLILTANNIGDDGAIALADVLHKTKLDTVYLAGNEVSDGGAEHLARACNKAEFVYSLHLERNFITKRGICQLGEILKSNNFLTHLYLAENEGSQDNNAKRILTTTVIQNRNLSLVDLGSGIEMQAGQLSVIRLLYDTGVAFNFNNSK